MGMALKGRTAAIVGYGGIGQEVAQRLAGFAMKILAVSRRGPKPGDVPVDFHGGPDSLHEVLRQADFIIVAPPLNDETRGLLGQAEFACMKPNAFVINVARGPVLDYDALLAALKEGRIAGAGLDVVETEPMKAANALWDLPNVIISPHVAGQGSSGYPQQRKLFGDNLARFREGRPMINACQLPART